MTLCPIVGASIASSTRIGVDPFAFGRSPSKPNAGKETSGTQSRDRRGRPEPLARFHFRLTRAAVSGGCSSYRPCPSDDRTAARARLRWTLKPTLRIYGHRRQGRAPRRLRTYCARDPLRRRRVDLSGKLRALSTGHFATSSSEGLRGRRALRRTRKGHFACSAPNGQRSDGQRCGWLTRPEAGRFRRDDVVADVTISAAQATVDRATCGPVLRLVSPDAFPPRPRPARRFRAVARIKPRNGRVELRRSGPSRGGPRTIPARSARAVSPASVITVRAPSGPRARQGLRGRGSRGDRREPAAGKLGDHRHRRRPRRRATSSAAWQAMSGRAPRPQRRRGGRLIVAEEGDAATEGTPAGT